MPKWLVRSICAAPYGDISNLDQTKEYDTEAEAVGYVQALRCLPGVSAFRVDKIEADGTKIHLGACIFNDQKYIADRIPADFTTGTRYDPIILIV